MWDLDLDLAGRTRDGDQLWPPGTWSAVPEPGGLWLEHPRWSIAVLADPRRPGGRQARALAGKLVARLAGRTDCLLSEPPCGAEPAEQVLARLRPDIAVLCSAAPSWGGDVHAVLRAAGAASTTVVLAAAPALRGGLLVSSLSLGGGLPAELAAALSG